MNANEFGRWLEYHSLMFPRLRTYTTDPDVVDAWIMCLSNVSESDARAVTLAMVDGEIDPGYPEDTARIVRLKAREMANARAAEASDKSESRRNGRLECGLCRDTGFATIWHPAIVAAYRKGVDVIGDPPCRAKHQDGTWKDISCAIACRCAAGARYAYRVVRQGATHEMVPAPRLGSGDYVIRSHGPVSMPSGERLAGDVESHDSTESRCVEWSL